ncbi:BnaA04g11850D [Brassica napus]|uniref:(rape) hypothetical protein n=1 Tax=Brassica napus TaxID=3708 RepID=A0A078FS19_BRANA|nr:unnamed protein product [Brassica napus]CDY15926.1 BnaA04g11850D [Brassica napus]
MFSLVICASHTSHLRTSSLTPSLNLFHVHASTACASRLDSPMASFPLSIIYTIPIPNNSFAAPLSRHESHEDNPIHALSQSVSFGRFTTESLEWGKWSNEEEEPKRTSEQEDVVESKTVIDDDLQAVIEVLDGVEEEENHAEDESSYVEEERKSVTKNSSLFRSEAPDKAMELVVTRKTSDNLMKNKEKPVRQKFSLLKFFMGNTNTQRQNSKRKSDKKPNKPFLCLCFNPDVVRETKGPTKTKKRNL